MAVVDAFGPALSAAQLAAAAFGLQLVTPEYASGSIRSTFLAQPRRPVVIAAKAIVAVAAAFLAGAVLGPVSCAAARLLLAGSVGQDLPWWASAVAASGLLAYAAIIGVALAFLTRSAVGALSLSFLLLAVSLAAPEPAADWLPGPAGADVVAALATAEIPARPSIVLTLWAVAALATATWLVRKRDT